MKKRPLSYQLLQHREDGQPKTLARVLCSKCDEKLDIHLTTGGNHVAVVEKVARRGGWLFHRNTARKCVCPKCYLGDIDAIQTLDAIESASLPSAITAQDAADLIETLPQTAMAAAFVAAAQEKKIMPQTKPQQAAQEKLPECTPNHKLQIRNFLGGIYDEKKFGYLDGWTDKKVGEHLNMPMAWIRDMREFAFGPLECDVEVSDLLDEIERVKRKQLEELAGLEKRVRNLEMARR